MSSDPVNSSDEAVEAAAARLEAAMASPRRWGKNSAIAAVAAAVRAEAVAEHPAELACCDLHGRNCERGGEECCRYCTEASHDFVGFRTGVHGDGSNCSRRDLSGWVTTPPVS